MQNPDGLRCPLNVKLLLWFHVCPEPYPDPESAPAIESGITMLLNYRAIKLTSAGDVYGKKLYETTPLGKAWVEAICNVLPPRTVFVDELNRIIDL